MDRLPAQIVKILAIFGKYFLLRTVDVRIKSLKRNFSRIDKFVSKLRLHLSKAKLTDGFERLSNDMFPHLEKFSPAIK